MATARRRLRLPRRALAPFALLLLLAAAAAVPGDDPTGLLSLANPEVRSAADMHALISTLPDRSLVLVGFDADLGTYPEIRPAVRAALDDLLAANARLAFVSLSPEGRALAAAEMDRLRRGGTDADHLADMGFVAGAEAGLVHAINVLTPDRERGPLGGAIRAAGDGIRAFDFVLLVAGMEIGPRAWVEQVGPRLPSLPMAGIAPTAMHPELSPYLRSGQLAALLATVRDGAAYVALVRAVPDGSPTSASDAPVDSLAVLGGMLVALLILSQALTGGLARGMRRGSA